MEIKNFRNCRSVIDAGNSVFFDAAQRSRSLANRPIAVSV